MTIRIIDNEIGIRKNSRWSGYTVYGIGDLPLAGTDTEAEAEQAKRAFENVLAPRFTRDEAIAIVKDAIARSSEPDSRLIPGIRLTLEALAECGAFRDGDHEHEPDGMRAMLNAAGIR